MRFKITLIIILSLVTLQVSAQSLQLNQLQQDLILSDLNNICGDTWCEGEYDLNFKAIYPQAAESKNIYVIEFLAKNTYENEAPTQQVNCEIEETALIQKIAANLNQPHISEDLQTQLYQKIDACIYEHLYSKQ